MRSSSAFASNSGRSALVAVAAAEGKDARPPRGGAIEAFRKLCAPKLS